MEILSIGNSFSQDAHRYINKIASSAGCKINTYNLYIGGCSLSMHFRNMLSDSKKYSLEMNGESTGFLVSLKEALLTRNWDVVTIQQASHESINYDYYQPYMNKIVEYVKEYVPKAKIAIHETWAYEEGSNKLGALGYTAQLDMYNALKAAYSYAKKDVKPDVYIPSGELLQVLLSSGIKRVHRDGYHLSYGIGRYAVGLLWAQIFLGRNIEDYTFASFDEDISDSDIKTVKSCVKKIAEKL